jgi:alginate O-acetyltransferase complex protein AlgI
MVFSSITFLCYFLPGFMLAYALLPCSNAVLLGGSLLFYAWGDLTRLPVLLACILLNWSCGVAIAAGRRRALTLGIVGNLALLVWFKYAGFLATQLATVATALRLPAVPIPAVTLPLGISFFTFQGISYLIDVHRGTVRAQPSLFRFAMYKAMFPPLIAGPIVRYAVIADRVDRRSVTLPALASGIEAFICGLGQKVLLANSLAGPVDRVFALPPGQLDPLTAWIGAVGYALQIYFDFAGYSNMAIGLGRMLGFELPINFDRPYAAQSVTAFWRRWHITLSTWFRDYVYIPLGGNRGGPARTYANLIVVFLLCGFWHGASWNFLAWGLYHGLFLTLERLGLGRVLAAAPAPLRHAYLVLVVVIGWVPFRTETLGSAGAMLGAMAGLTAPGATAAITFPAGFGLVLATAALLSVWPRGLGRWTPAPLRQGAGIAVLIAAAASLAAGTYNPFIYFRF